MGNSDPAAWNAFSASNRDTMETMIAASIQLRDLIETDIQAFFGVGNFSQEKRRKLSTFVNGT